MENRVIYVVLVKYVDSIGRERTYSREFTTKSYAMAYFCDKINNAKSHSEFIVYRISRIGFTKYCDIIRRAFLG